MAFKSIKHTGQIMYLAKLDKQVELWNWQLEKIRLGLEHAKNNFVATKFDVLKVLNKVR